VSELRGARFGIGVDPVVDWRRELPCPVLAAYEARIEAALRELREEGLL
jgi:hypothetical protein